MRQKIVNSQKKLVSPALVNALRAICVGGVHLDVNLAQFSHWRVGGSADCIVRPRSTKDLASVVKLLRSQSIPYVVIGSTSNLLFADEGLRAVAIQLGIEMSAIKISNHRVWCQGGIWVPGFTRHLLKASLSGAEHACGIPGTIGGLVYMNGGSQRKGIGDYLVSVLAVTSEGELQRYNRNECKFSYRSSVFQKNNAIISEVEFEYPKMRSTADVRREMLNVLRSRKKKFPRKLPNCGSVFVSNPAMYKDYGPPGAVIEKCGLKGVERNNAQISPVHANFIVNNGGASAADILYLIHLVGTTVESETGYSMRAEARFINSDGTISAADEEANLIFGFD